MADVKNTSNLFIQTPPRKGLAVLPWPATHYIEQAGLEHTPILLPVPPDCGHERCALPQLHSIAF